MTCTTSTNPVRRALRPFSGSQRLMLSPKNLTHPSFFSFSTVDRNSGSSAQLSSQTWNCSTSMLSTRSFFRIKSAYLKTCSAEKTSRYLYSGKAGHRSLAGGTFEAAYNRLPEFCCMASPSSSSLFPLPYAHAVSKKLQPRSTAICIDERDSPSSDPVHPLIPQSPSPISLTSKFVRPSLRYFIIASSKKCSAGVPPAVWWASRPPERAFVPASSASSRLPNHHAFF